MYRTNLVMEYTASVQSDLSLPFPVQVNSVTEKLFRVAPNPQALSKMAHEDLQQIIRYVFGAIAVRHGQAALSSCTRYMP